MTRGLFIALEGGEGVGKTTLCTFLANHLRDHHRTVEIVADPGTSILGQQLRTLLLDRHVPMSSQQALLLYTAARASLVQDIENLLQAGTDVIIGRWLPSTQVYQGTMGRIAQSDITMLHNKYVRMSPDICVILDCPPAIAIDRKIQDNGVGGVEDDRYESKSLEWHQQLREGYQALSANEGHPLIDASGALRDVQAGLVAACRRHDKFNEIVK